MGSESNNEELMLLKTYKKMSYISDALNDYPISK